MELRHLRYFAEVAERLSFVKAAESLNISQPPLSRQIHELEAEIGTALFLRDSRGTSLTKAGEYFQLEVKQLLAQVDAVCRTAKIVGEVSSKSFRIGCGTFLLQTILPPFVRRIADTWPDLKLELLVMSTEAQEQALRSGAIDFGFLRSWIRQNGLVFEPLLEERLTLVYPQSACYCQDPKICMSRLAGSPLIALAQESSPGLTERNLAICANHGFVPQVAYECNDAYSLIKLVASGLGWSIVSDLGIDQLPEGVGAVDLDEPMTLGLCYRDAPRAESLQKVIDLAREHFSNFGRTLPPWRIHEKA